MDTRIQDQPSILWMVVRLEEAHYAADRPLWMQCDHECDHTSSIISYMRKIIIFKMIKIKNFIFIIFIVVARGADHTLQSGQLISVILHTWDPCSRDLDCLKDHPSSHLQLYGLQIHLAITIRLDRPSNNLIIKSHDEVFFF